MTGAPILTATAAALGQYRKTAAAVLGIAAAVLGALYPADYPRWATVASAGIAAALVYLLPNAAAPTSTSTRPPSPLPSGSAPGAPSWATGTTPPDGPFAAIDPASLQLHATPDPHAGDG